MDVTQASELLSGLPLSSSIAIEVFHHTVQRYLEDCDREAKREEAFEERRKQAFLAAPLGRVEEYPSILSGWAWGSHPTTWKPPDERIVRYEPDEWVFSYASIHFSSCEEAGLCLRGCGVSSKVGYQRAWSSNEKPTGVVVAPLVTLDDSNWFVSAWIPHELSDYEPAFREALPLPEMDDFTDCSRTESEWFVIFWAMVEMNPEHQNFSPVPRPPDEPFKDSAGIRKFTRLVGQRTPINHLVRCLASIELADIKRIETGRVILVKVLLNQCLRRAVSRVRNDPLNFDLVEFNDDLKDVQRPEFLNVWKSPYWPTTDTLEAIRQWLTVTFQALEQWQASLQAPAKGDDVISVGFAQQAFEDAWRLARHVRDRYGIKNVPQPLTDDSLFVVIQYLDRLRQAIFETPQGEAVTRPQSGSQAGSDKARWLQVGSPPNSWPSKRICGLLKQLAAWEGTSEKTLKAHNPKGVRWWIVECGGTDDETGWLTPYAIYYPSEAKFLDANKRRREEIDLMKREENGREQKKPEVVSRKRPGK